MKEGTEFGREKGSQWSERESHEGRGGKKGKKLKMEEYIQKKK